MPEREPLTEEALREIGEYFSGFTRGGHYMGPLMARLHREHAERGRRIAELEALFQQTHGVHVDWVAKEAQQRERIAELERACADWLAKGLRDGERIAALEAEVRVLRGVAEAARPVVIGDSRPYRAGIRAALDALAAHDKERS